VRNCSELASSLFSFSPSCLAAEKMKEMKKKKIIFSMFWDFQELGIIGSAQKKFFFFF
jgi:hypothetical protein